MGLMTPGQRRAAEESAPDAHYVFDDTLRLAGQALAADEGAVEVARANRIAAGMVLRGEVTEAQGAAMVRAALELAAMGKGWA